MRYKPKVVYDCDGVLIGLNEAAHKIVGVDLTKRKYYNIRKEGYLTKEQQDGMIKAYNEVETFKQAEIYSGFHDIFDVEESDLAEVYIHSLSYKQEIANYKLELLSGEFPDKTRDRFLLECGDGKSTMDDIDILVEDSIENIMKSKAKLGNIMIKQAYNRPENYGTSLELLRAIEVENLEQANIAVKLLLLNKITLY